MRTQCVRERSSWRDLPHWFKRSPDGSCGARSWTLHGNIGNTGSTGYSALKGQQEPSTANRVARGPILELAGSGMHSYIRPTYAADPRRNARQRRRYNMGDPRLAHSCHTRSGDLIFEFVDKGISHSQFRYAERRAK